LPKAEAYKFFSPVVRRMSDKVTYKQHFEFLYETALLQVSEMCGNVPREEKTWHINYGNLKSICWRTITIPKACLSLVIRERENESLYRIGLNIYAQNHRVPDGSFSVLLSCGEEVSFIGGVIELFPATRIDEDIKMFKNSMQAVAREHGQDYEMFRKGLVGTFRLKGSDETLGAEAGFNFYQAGLEASSENLLFAGDAFLSSLSGYRTILQKENNELSSADFTIKEKFWRLHLKYMREEDVGIKMSLEQGMPMDFFTFSAFPPVEEELY
jgi:coproporphyrinogen III oxidase